MSERFVQFRYSKNGGQTWSDWRTASMGEVGDFTKRVTFRRLGQSRQWTFHIRMTVPATVIAASVQIEGNDG